MKDLQNKMEFYRYELVTYASYNYITEEYESDTSNVKVVLRTYNLHKETPKGYWIGYGGLDKTMLRISSKWISKTSIKRFAYPTKQGAMDNFIKRTEKRIKIQEYDIIKCKNALSQAETLKKYI